MPLDNYQVRNYTVRDIIMRSIQFLWAVIRTTTLWLRLATLFDAITFWIPVNLRPKEVVVVVKLVCFKRFFQLKIILNFCSLEVQPMMLKIPP